MSDDREVAQGLSASVSTYMSDEVVTVAPDATLHEVAATISEESVGLVVIGSKEDVRGVVSERDIARAVGRGADLDAETAGDLEQSSLVWATVDSTIAGVANEMMEGYVRHVLVGDDGGLVGIVSMRDVIIALAAS